MILKSMVPSSTFDEILGSLRSDQFAYISRQEATRSFPACLFVGANVSLDKICQITKVVCATVAETEDLDTLPYDQLVVELHDTTGDCVSDTKTGEICLWGPYGEAL